MEIIKALNFKYIFVLLLLGTWLSNIVTVTTPSPACQDEIPDCELHKKRYQDFCTGEFSLFAAVECRKTCGFCSVLGSLCENDTICGNRKGSNVSCINVNETVRTCQCSPGFHAFDEKLCYEVHARNCSNSTDCDRLSNSACTKDNNRSHTGCFCKPGYYYNSPHYSCNEVYERNCTDATDCNNLANSNCSQKSSMSHTRCICKEGYYYNTTNHSCNKGCQDPFLDNTITELTNRCNENPLYKHGEALQYRCKHGYGFNSTSSIHINKTTICRENGTFQSLEPCLIKECTVPSPLGNVTLLDKSLTNQTLIFFSSTVRYQCITGYGFQPNSTSYEIRNVTCQDNANFDSFTECVQIECQVPAAVDHITLITNTSKKETFFYRDTIEYKCVHGYAFTDSANAVSSRNITCGENATFDNFTDCMQLDCSSSLPNITNGNATLVTQLTTVESKANVTCASGFYTNQPQLTCNQSGNKASWTISTCEKVLESHCKDEYICSIVPNATCSEKKETNNKTCQCSPGFYMVDGILCDEVHGKNCTNSTDCSGLSYSTCTNDTVMSSTRCFCSVGYFYNSTKYSCDKVLLSPCDYMNIKEDCTRVLHAKCTENNTCVCGAGFEMINGLQCSEVYNKTCGSSNKETQCEYLTNSTCQIATVTSTTLPISTLQVTSSTVRTVFENGRCVCTDEHYYHKENETHASCLPGCQALNVNNTTTKLTNKSNENALYKHGEALQYRCKDGYGFNSTSSIHINKTTICRENGTFQSLETCLLKVCKVPNYPENITLLNNATASQTFLFNATVDYQCTEGFGFHENATFHENKSITCGDNAEFDNYNECHHIVCKVPNHPENITLLNNVTVGEIYVFNATVDYQCRTGFGFHENATFHENKSITCGDNAEFDNYKECFQIGNCRANCQLSPTNMTDSCDVTTGKCLYGCRPGFAGSHCLFECPQNCKENSTLKEMCNVTTGECFSGCKTGFTGPNCTVACSIIDRSCRTCYKDASGSSLVCTECEKNFYRSNGKCVACNYWCQENVSSVCISGCKYPSYCDPTCEVACNDGCLSQRCNQSCVCDNGCIPTRWGEQCENLCSSSCRAPRNSSLNVCDRHDGSCMFGCQDRWYGKHCDYQCAVGCKNRTCFSDTGNCSQGCVAGLHGPKCDKALERPRMCFECEDMSSPMYCDSVTHCRSNEICFLEAHIQGHGRIYRSGCMEEQKCHTMEKASSGSVCVECCDKDMCNNMGCSNTDFLPREQRGPVCFDCHHIGDPNKCEHISMCTTNQVCSIEKIQWGESYQYKQGCAHPVCNSLSRLRRSIPICHSCCTADYCNLNCTANTSGEVFVG